MRILGWLITHVVALAVAAWLLDGIWLDGATTGRAEWTDKAGTLVVVALILGVVSVTIEPLVKFFSLPFIVLTIGLFLWVINALMLMLTSWIAGQLDQGFHVDGFVTAMLGALIITLVTGFIDLVALEDD